ncbi:MAG: DUF6807 family protein [Pirellulales bacterium]
MPRIAVCSLALILLSLAAAASAAEKSYTLSVDAGKFDRENTPVVATITVPDELKEARVAVIQTAAGDKWIGQLTAPGVLNDVQQPNTRELHFVLPELAANETLELTATVGGGKSDAEQFSWQDESGQHAELKFGDRPVLRYMYEAVDNSTPQRRGETYKVYHHVYDPTGSRYVTKGPGGLFPHHRGLFFGFNKISYEADGKKQAADVWHNNKGENQSHVKFLNEETGPVLGRHTALINWNGRDGNTFAEEHRQIAAYHIPGGTMIEFADLLQTKVGPIKLDGDPQHAGFQFRATQDVPDKTKNQTYYVRPDGQGKPGQFRNWPANKDHADLAFNGLSMVIDGKRYTVCYLDSPANPKEARYSERDYGRFGSYFEATVTDDEPLRLNYRVWLQEGEMTPEQITRLSNDFVAPPIVTVAE